MFTNRVGSTLKGPGTKFSKLDIIFHYEFIARCYLMASLLL